MIKFESFFAVLNKNRVRYLVIGGIAVNLYGIERATADIDLFVELEKGNINRFVKAVREAGLKPKAPVRLEDFADPDKRNAWRIEKGMIAFSLFDPKNSFFLLDVLTESPVDFKKAFSERSVRRAGRVVIPVASLEDLIRMKKASGRAQDEADVFYLKRILKGWKDEG
ncbi:MAG: hypothetical protein HZB83_08035 [Deltaproteobacteria bacterium]|nr:hypothetical protein [Deltaproteobacteria bacterium]